MQEHMQTVHFEKRLAPEFTPFIRSWFDSMGSPQNVRHMPFYGVQIRSFY